MTENPAAADARAWKEVGKRLAAARRAMRPKVSGREAARRAGMADITYRQLEAGERQIARGVKIPVSPKDETLLAAVHAVGLDPAEIFALVGRVYEGGELAAPTPAPSDDVRAEVDEVKRRLDAIEALLQELRPPRRSGTSRKATR